MVIVQQNSKRKPTGGMHSTLKKMRKHEMGGDSIKTTLGAAKIKKARTKGGNVKIKLRTTEFANLTDQKAKTVKKVKITDVLENPANPHFVRQKIITRGAIIQTDAGKARVTSRPGQDGIVNAVKVE